MNAEIITIGDELLIGQVIDTNSAWLGIELNKIGIKINYKIVVGDNKPDIVKALTVAEQRSDIVFITGGLGPTKDDETKPALCDFFNTKLVQNEKVLAHITKIFVSRNLPIIEANIFQSYIPDNCEILWNDSGTAPGMWFTKNNKVFVSMPGVPFEMKSIFSKIVLPKIISIFSLPTIYHRTIQTISIGESFLAKKIEALENALPNYIKLAYLPAIGSVRLRFSAYGKNKIALENEVNEIVNNLYDLIGEYIFGEGEDCIEKTIGILLKGKSETLSIAESCTGGYISHLITSIAGSSNYFMGSIVSYDNKIKTQELNISNEILNTEGAVSEACVLQMANNIKNKFKTTYAIATSGIAGPTGGTVEKPIGTVWIAIATPTNTFAKVFNMGENRERTIHRTALMALDLLRKELLKN